MAWLIAQYIADPGPVQATESFSTAHHPQAADTVPLVLSYVCHKLKIAHACKVV